MPTQISRYLRSGRHSGVFHRRRGRALSVLLVALLTGGCASSLMPLDVYIVGLEPQSSTLLEQRLRVDLRVQNPNDLELAVDGVRIALDVNGKRFARGVSDESFAVPRLGEATFSLMTTTSVFDVVRQVMAVSKSQSLDYEMSGRLFLASGLRRSVSFERTGQLTLAQDGSAADAIRLEVLEGANGP